MFKFMPKQVFKERNIHRYDEYLISMRDVVKTYQTEVAVNGVLPIIGDGTRVLSMQNGIGNTDVMAGILGKDKVLSGITYHSIQHTGPNKLRYRVGIKPIQIAPYEGKPGPEVEKIGEVFRKAGLNTDVVRNIDHVIWQKLLHNAVVNPVSAVTGLNCNQLLDDPDLPVRMRALEILADRPISGGVEQGLMKVLRHDESMQMRLLAIEVLANSDAGGQRVLEDFLETDEAVEPAIAERLASFIQS